MLEVFVEKDDLRGAGKAFALRELGTTVGHDDAPAEQGGHLHEGLGVVAGTEEDEALGRVEMFGEFCCGG